MEIKVKIKLGAWFFILSQILAASIASARPQQALDVKISDSDFWEGGSVVSQAGILKDKFSQEGKIQNYIAYPSMTKRPIDTPDHFCFEVKNQEDIEQIAKAFKDLYYSLVTVQTLESCEEIKQ